MKLVGKPKLEQFKAEFPESKGSLDAWRAEVEDARWSGPDDIRARYGSASLENGDISGANVTFRLMDGRVHISAAVHYRSKLTMVRNIGVATR